MQEDLTRRDELRDLARAYLKMAGQLLHPPRPALVAVGGLSGSGKSRLAAGVAPFVGAVPGAVLIRSDEIRKRLCGVDPLQRLGPEGYTADVTQRVYATMTERAATVVRAGYAAIADAVFARPSDREAIERAAATAGVPFVGIWLDAPHDVLVARAAQRHGDPSDADAAVIQGQLEADTGQILWHRIDASFDPDHVLERATAVIEHELARRSVRAIS